MFLSSLEHLPVVHYILYCLVFIKYGHFFNLVCFDLIYNGSSLTCFYKTFQINFQNRNIIELLSLKIGLTVYFTISIIVLKREEKKEEIDGVLVNSLRQVLIGTRFALGIGFHSLKRTVIQCVEISSTLGSFTNH